MKKKYHYKSFLVAILLIILIGISIEIRNEKEADRMLKTTSANQINLLKAYQENDEKKIRKYFENWQEESKKLTKTEYSNELEKDLYAIYKEMFHPYQMAPLFSGSLIDGYEIDLIQTINRAAYIITQNEINYTFFDLKGYDPNDILWNINIARISRDQIKTMEDFYPPVDLKKNNVLHLTEKYEADLNEFLGTKELNEEARTSFPARLQGEYLQKYQFIRQYIPIMYGHWGGYWHFATHPEVYIVYFDNDKETAVAEYRIGFRFGSAYLRKENGTWKIVWTILNGIE